MMKQLLILIFVVTVSGLWSCRKDDHDIPYVYVDFYISITDPNFSALNSPGGWVYVTGGSKGILIYAKTTTEFMAYERHCPYDPEASCSRIEVQTSGLLTEDACCGSVYLITDGTPSSGPGTAGQALKKYQTTFDGQTIHVFN